MTLVIVFFFLRDIQGMSMHKDSGYDGCNRVREGGPLKD
ncbi:hypothetical protein ASZ90_020105 [hydrocarbon metagenome]|uniref:Uncharacterized protein n=1 Tax=hydrocarbon metagenome TaxID=938273 RepID=A0A0W8E1W5_9ZZZZ